MNDIVHCSSIFKFTMYADDACVYFSDRNAVTGVEIINRELVLVTKWIRTNRLTLNMDNCHYIVFHRHKRSLPNLLPQVEIENFEIEKCFSTKYLVVHLDETLRWNVHINSIIRKISKFVPILYNIRSCLDRTSLKLLYNCLIYPFLIYCNPVWGAANDTVLNPLIVFQKKIIRVISFKRRYEHTRPLFVELKILIIKTINEYMSGLSVHKSLMSNNNLFTRYESAVYNTRLSNRNTVVIPNIVSKHLRQSVKWVGCSVWNSIPQILRDTDSYQGFNNNFKHHLIATEAT